MSVASNADILIRGAGDLASGVALRLHRAKYRIVITEVAQPLAVRRAVSFSEAVYKGSWEIEDVVAEKVDEVGNILEVIHAGRIPIVVDPDANIRHTLNLAALIDGRMLKHPSELALDAAPFIIGMGPGFAVGIDCHAVVETKRGHYLGRVYWEGSAQENTGIPDPVAGYDVQRVIRAPVDGVLTEGLPIGAVVELGDPIVRVGDKPVTASFRGALRGLLHDGVSVTRGLKIGDLDPRAERAYCFQVSDKAFAVGGGVLEALFSKGILPSGTA
jgi:xanthine dehydrogenase accessory factor